eukprot:1139473-Pelagomonas_calceolata.AAC.2
MDDGSGPCRKPEAHTEKQLWLKPGTMHRSPAIGQKLAKTKAGTSCVDPSTLALLSKPRARE